MNEFFLKFAAPFVKSTKETFRVMLSTEVTMHSPRIKSNNLAEGDITSLIGINGVYTGPKGKQDFRGLLALSFTEATFLRVASAMLGEEFTEYSADIADTGSELANIILGSAKPDLVAMGIQLTLTSPTSIRGQKHEIAFPKNSIVVETSVKSELGELFLDLCCQDMAD